MDFATETECVFNLKLARLVGLYQILDPNAARVAGYNVYHAVIGAFTAFVAATSMLFPVGLYRLSNDAIAFAFYVGCVGNYFFACYKIASVLCRSRGIWRCADVTGFDFMRSYRSYGRAGFAEWRSRSVRVSYVYAGMALFALLVWGLTPRLVGTATTVTIRNRDGTHDAYRMNIFNVYPMAGDRAYNGHYDAFYAAESVILVSFLYFSTIFDVLMVTMCFALSCQLDAVCEAIRSLGHAANDTKQIQNVFKLGANINVYDDLKSIVEDHQHVMKKLSDYYNIMRSVILSQMFVASASHILIWFIAAMSFSEGEKGDSILTIKLFTILPVFTFQLLMTCYLFGTINEKKDGIVYALYSSNWTDMDIKSKKLVLCTMGLNNAHQLKIKVTRSKIVNLEMFSQTMRACYSIFSMLINYKRK